MQPVFLLSARHHQQPFIGAEQEMGAGFALWFNKCCPQDECRLFQTRSCAQLPKCSSISGSRRELYFSSNAEMVVGKVRSSEGVKIFRRNSSLGEELLQWTWGCAL